MKQVVAGSTLLAMTWAVHAHDAPNPAAASAVTVVGVGRVSADPDRAVVRVGATIERSDGARAARVA